MAGERSEKTTGGEVTRTTVLTIPDATQIFTEHDKHATDVDITL